MEDDTIESQLKMKESEIRELLNLKIRTLETKVLEKENQLQLLNLRNQELQKDFEYNLSIIQDRDNDIKELTENMLKLKDILETKQVEINELRNALNECELKFNNEKTKLKNKEKTLLEKIEDLKHENKNLKQSETEEIKRTKSEHEKQLRILQGIISEHEENIKNLTQELEERKKGLSTEQKRIEESFTNQIKSLKSEKDELTNLNKKLQEEVHGLREELAQKSKEYLAKNMEDSNKVSELKIQIKHLESVNLELSKENEDLKRNSNTWNSALQEKFDNLKLEKEQLQEKLLQQKMKYKNKIAMLKDLNDKKLEELIREQNIRIRKYEDDLKQAYLEREKQTMTEKSLREKIQDLEYRIQKELRFGEERISQLQKNYEQDLKKAKNDLDLKEFQLTHLKEEKEELQNKLNDLTNQNKNLEEQLLNIEQENKYLIEEIAHYRSEQPLTKTGKKDILLLSPDKEKKKSPLKNQKNLEEDESALFSDDMGPASPLHSIDMIKSSLAMQKSKKILKNDSHSYMNVLAEQLEIAQKENTSLKEIIDKLRIDMETVRYSMDLKNQELELKKEENLQLRNRVNQLEKEMLELRKSMAATENLEYRVKEYENTKKTLEKDLEEARNALKQNQEELSQLKTRILQTKSENEKLKIEREQLIEISSGLQSKLNRYKEGGFADEGKLHEMENELKSYQAENNKLKSLIEKLKKVIPPSYRLDLNTGEVEHAFGDQIPEKENRNYRLREDLTRGSIERFKSRIEDYRHELSLESNKKPIVEAKTGYTPNSQKATKSQKEVEQQLKNKKKTPTKVRNYNIKDDDDV